MIVEVPADNLRERKPVITACQADARNGIYAQVMGGYVQWIAGDYDRLVMRKEAEVSRFRNAAGAFAHLRTATQIGAMAYGLSCFLEYAITTGAIEKEEALTSWNTWWTTLMETGQLQEGYAHQQDIRKRFMGLLREVLMGGWAHIVDSVTLTAPETTPELWGWHSRRSTSDEVHTPGRDPSSELSAGGNRIGYLHEDKVRWDWGPTYAAISRLADEQNQPIPLNRGTLLRRIGEAGLIERDGPHNKVKCTIPGFDQRQRMVVIKKMTLFAEKSGASGAQELGPTNSTRYEGKEVEAKISKVGRCPTFEIPSPSWEIEEVPINQIIT